MQNIEQYLYKSLSDTSEASSSTRVKNFVLVVAARDGSFGSLIAFVARAITHVAIVAYQSINTAVAVARLLTRRHGFGQDCFTDQKFNRNVMKELKTSC